VSKNPRQVFNRQGSMRYIGTIRQAPRSFSSAHISGRRALAARSISPEIASSKGIRPCAREPIRGDACRNRIRPGQPVDGRCSSYSSIFALSPAGKIEMAEQDGRAASARRQTPARTTPQMRLQAVAPELRPGGGSSQSWRYLLIPVVHFPFFPARAKSACALTESCRGSAGSTTTAPRRPTAPTQPRPRDRRCRNTEVRLLDDMSAVWNAFPGTASPFQLDSPAGPRRRHTRPVRTERSRRQGGANCGSRELPGAPSAGVRPGGWLVVASLVHGPKPNRRRYALRDSSR